MIASLRTGTTRAGLVLGLLSVCSCVTPVEGFRSPNMGGLKQASFDMSCPPDQLNVEDLGSATWTIGVSGCGKKAVYKYFNGAWVNNTGSDDSKK
jgi:hypothetical protein